MIQPCSLPWPLLSQRRHNTPVINPSGHGLAVPTVHLTTFGSLLLRKSSLSLSLSPAPPALFVPSQYRPSLLRWNSRRPPI